VYKASGDSRRKQDRNMKNAGKPITFYVRTEACSTFPGGVVDIFRGEEAPEATSNDVVTYTFFGTEDLWGSVLSLQASRNPHNYKVGKNILRAANLFFQEQAWFNFFNYQSRGAYWEHACEEGEEQGCKTCQMVDDNEEKIHEALDRAARFFLEGNAWGCYNSLEEAGNLEKEFGAAPQLEGMVRNLCNQYPLAGYKFVE
jgi:hypothetical protein